MSVEEGSPKDSCDCKPEKPIKEETVVKERKEPTGNDEIEPRSCGYCIHQRSCGAYWMTKKMVNEFHKEFGNFVKFPFPLTMLALKCKEFKDKRKIIDIDDRKKQR